MISLSILVFIAWIILNGRLTVEIALFGLAIIAVVWLLILVLVPKEHRHRYPLLKGDRVIQFIWILLVEVIKANVDMVRIVLFVDEADLTPAYTKIRPGLRGRVGLTALTSSITLTPGTITVAANDEELYIHALDISMLEGINESIFVQKLKELEGSHD